jgi:WD40 repeat protein
MRFSIRFRYIFALWFASTVHVRAGQRVEIIPFAGHSASITAVAYSSDGKYILTGSTDRTAILWDAAMLTPLRTFSHAARGWQVYVSCVAFSPDGRQILTGAHCGDAILWDSATGRKLHTFQVDNPKSIAFTPDGKSVITTAVRAQQGSTVLWDVASGLKIREFGGSDCANSVAVSPDGKCLCTGSFSGKVIVWETDTGREVGVVQHSGEVSAVAFSPDGRHLISSSEDGTKVTDLASGKLLERRNNPIQSITSTALSAEGNRALVVDGKNWRQNWDTNAIRVEAYEKSGLPDGGILSPDGKTVLMTPNRCDLITSDVRTGKRISSFRGGNCVRAIACTRDGKRIITCSDEGFAHVWDTVQGRMVRVIQQEEVISSLACNRDASLLLVGNMLWDTHSGKLIREIPGTTGRLAMSEDGNQVLSHNIIFGPDGGWSDTAILWDTNTGEEIREFPSEWVVPHALAISPDSRRILTKDHGAHVWDSGTGLEIAAIPAPERGVDGWINWVDFSADGKKVVTCARSGDSVLSDAADGRTIRTFKEESVVEYVSISPDGKCVLTVSREAQPTLWNAETGKRLRALEGHTDDVLGIAFTPDSKHVLTGSADGTTRLWKVETGAELGRIITRGPDWLLFTPQGTFDCSEGGQRFFTFRDATTNALVDGSAIRNRYHRPGLLASLLKE